MKNRVRTLRAGAGWTQEQLGRRLGVSRQAVNAVETEKHDPSLDLAFRIATVFGVAVEALFENPHGNARLGPAPVAMQANSDPDAAGN